MRIAIIGAGLAGLCAAKGLLDEGAGEITVFEREQGPGLATSFANGALLHPSTVDPWNSPGILGYLLRNLGNPRAPVMLRPSALPSLIGWGWRFVRESSPERHRAHTLANVALALHSVKLMQGVRQAGIDYGAAQRGTLVVHRDAAEWERAQTWSRELQQHGVPSRLLGRDELVATEPALAAVAPQLLGGVHSLGDESGDAYRFCTALGDWLGARGVRLRMGCEVRSLSGDRRRVDGVRLADGSVERFDAVVVAAAIWSESLTAPLGLKLPVRPAKGYSVTLPRPADGPITPVVDNALHIAVVPVVGERLRLAGTAEFCGMNRRIDPSRVNNLLRQLLALYPRIAERSSPQDHQLWTGLRPLCADGKPLIGATRTAGLYLHTGHGQLGWTTGVASGQMLARRLLGRECDVDPTPFAPSRFGL